MDFDFIFNNYMGIIRLTLCKNYTEILKLLLICNYPYKIVYLTKDNINLIKSFKKETDLKQIRLNIEKYNKHYNENIEIK